MRIGIGLPNTIPGAAGHLIPAWAQRAEALGFDLVATVDRVVYSNGEALTCLAAAAVATSRIELLTDILLAPTRLPALLAKEAATVDWLSGGRLTLGLAPGGRPDDFSATGMRFDNRGRRFDALLDRLQATWRGEPLPGTARPIGPAPVRGGIPILVGGASPQAIARAVRVGAGWTAGSAAAGVLGSLADQVKEAWAAAGRAGSPRIVTLAYFALGEGALERAAPYLHDYYGRERGEAIMQRMGRDAGSARAAVDAAEQAGAGEIVLFPTIADLAQVDDLAAALGLG
jgi:alkanesulfonate monooxygenase SsuD/methylene tetrahydromethanopterin reductase-like flavin-dependent oxidoreductase (luciferase family)